MLKAAGSQSTGAGNYVGKRVREEGPIRGVGAHSAVCFLRQMENVGRSRRWRMYIGAFVFLEGCEGAGEVKKLARKMKMRKKKGV